MEACEYFSPKLKSVEHDLGDKLNTTLVDLVKNLTNDLS